MRKPAAAGGKGALADFSALPQPALPTLERPYGVLVTGVGGTGVVTIGGLLGIAAHLEQKGVTVLDMAGLAQKGGAVISHVQIAPTPAALHATRIATGEARLVIGCDAIVSASPEVLSKTRIDVTAAAINSANTPTADFIKNPNWKFPGASAEQDLRASVGDACSFTAHALASIKAQASPTLARRSCSAEAPGNFQFGFLMKSAATRSSPPRPRSCPRPGST